MCVHTRKGGVVRAYMGACSGVCVYAHTWVCVQGGACMRVCMGSACAYMGVCSGMCVCIHRIVCTCVCVHDSMSVHGREHVSAKVYTYACVCMLGPWILALQLLCLFGCLRARAASGTPRPGFQGGRAQPGSCPQPRWGRRPQRWHPAAGCSVAAIGRGSPWPGVHTHLLSPYSSPDPQ